MLISIKFVIKRAKANEFAAKKIDYAINFLTEMQSLVKHDAAAKTPCQMIFQIKSFNGNLNKQFRKSLFLYIYFNIALASSFKVPLTLQLFFLVDFHIFQELIFEKKKFKNIESGFSYEC